MDEKKIVDVLMDDDTFIVKKRGEESTNRSGEEKDEIEGQKEVKKTEKPVKSTLLPEIDRAVLRSVIFETKEPRIIARTTGYPEIVVKKALERLIERGYLTEELEPTEKVSEVRWLKPVKVSIKYGKSRRVAIIDVAIIITVFLFLFSLLHYLFL